MAIGIISLESEFIVDVNIVYRVIGFGLVNIIVEVLFFLLACEARTLLGGRVTHFQVGITIGQSIDYDRTVDKNKT